MMRRTVTITSIVLLTFLTGCAASESDTSHSPNTDQGSHSDARTAAVSLDASWAKAGSGMSGMFGELHNNTDEDLTITNLSSKEAGIVQLHEVTSDGKMQEITDPVRIPAQGSLKLVPGGNHIMLMDLPNELLPGDTVTVTLELSNGSSAPLTALVKNFDGANESYEDISNNEHTEHEGH